MNEKRDERQKQSPPEPPRDKEPRQAKPDSLQEPLDERSLDDVLRDCPL